MALQLVDIFGNLQPATGNTLSKYYQVNFAPLYKNFKVLTPVTYAPNKDGRDYDIVIYEGSKNYSWPIISEIVNNRFSENTSPDFDVRYRYTKINENTIEKVVNFTGALGYETVGKNESKKYKQVIHKNPNYITVAYIPIKSFFGNFEYYNIYVNIEETDIFKKTIGSKLDCIREFDKLNFKVEGDQATNGYIDRFGYAVSFDNYFEIQTFTTKTPELKSSDEWEKALINIENKIKDYLQQFNSDLKQALDNGLLKKEEVPSCFLPDPDPALSGPPTQTISGVTNKPPTVDDPNIKLPSQEVKSLTATSATDAVSQATPSVQVGPAVQQAQGAASGAIGQAQGAASGAIGQAQGAASGAIGQAQGAASGAIGQAQGAAGNVQQSAGGILNNLSSGVTGALGGGALGAGIGDLAGGGRGALIGAGAGALAGGIVGTVVDKLNPKGIKPDGLGKDWSPDKFSPEAIAGNTKYVDPKTGQIGSTAKLANALGGAALGGGIGAGIGAIAGGGQGALVGGLSGGAIGAGAALGGIGGTALAGAGLGGGIGAAVGGGQGALIGAASGGVVGAAAAKLASVQQGLPKPNIPKPPNTPRIKTLKIPRPDSTKGAQALLNLPKSPTF